MSRTPDDLAELLVLLLADLAEEYGWPRLRALSRAERETAHLLAHEEGHSALCPYST